MPKSEPFDKYSAEYDDWFTENPEGYAAELETVRRLMPVSGTETIEIGIGSGKFAGPLNIKTGVDPAHNMLARTKKLGISVCRGVAEALPFPDDRFNLVLMVTTICFVDDIRRSFREAFRILKNNGCIIVAFIDRESLLGHRYAEKKEKSRFYREAVFFSAAEVLEHLKKSGFAISDVRQTLVPGEPPETVLQGFGEGSFVAIKGLKNRAG